jgi:hypothetical protein
LNQYENIDAVILLVGVNDLTSRLRQDASYDTNFLQRADAEQQLLRRNFSIVSDKSLPFYKKDCPLAASARRKDLRLPAAVRRGRDAGRGGKDICHLEGTKAQCRRDPSNAA